MVADGVPWGGAVPGFSGARGSCGQALEGHPPESGGGGLEQRPSV